MFAGWIFQLRVWKLDERRHTIKHFPFRLFCSSNDKLHSLTTSFVRVNSFCIFFVTSSFAPPLKSTIKGVRCIILVKLFRYCEEKKKKANYPYSQYLATILSRTIFDRKVTVSFSQREKASGLKSIVKSFWIHHEFK